MTYETIPIDVTNQIESFVASGAYQSRDAVLRDALAALTARRRLAAELQEAYDDIEAGRGTSIEAMEEELKNEFDFLRGS